MATRFFAALAVSAVVLGAGAANAADLPARMVTKAPMAPPVELFSWTGFYIGANLGFGSARTSSDISSNIIITDTSQTQNGVVGGGQVGYNWQSGPWVFGVELDGQGTSQDATWNGTIGGTAVSQQTSLPWFMTARGRIGYAIAPTWMVYVTGGGAWGEIKSTVTATGPGTATWDTTRGGWVLGAGIEGAINRQWSWKVEYLHIDLGSSNTVLFGMAPASVSLTNDIGRVGINFHL